jgi:hypothetical protein
MCHPAPMLERDLTRVLPALYRTKKWHPKVVSAKISFHCSQQHYKHRGRLKWELGDSKMVIYTCSSYCNKLVEKQMIGTTKCQRTISTQKLKLLGEVPGYDLYYSLTHPLKWKPFGLETCTGPHYLVLNFLSNKWGWCDSNSRPLGHQGSDTMSKNHLNPKA